MDNFTFGNTKACQYLAIELSNFDKSHSYISRKVTHQIKRTDVLIKKLILINSKDPEFFIYLYSIIKKEIMSQLKKSNLPILIKSLSENVINYKFKQCLRDSSKLRINNYGKK